MDFPLNFICAPGDAATLEKPVPAPYFRKRFSLKSAATSGELLLCGLGFYELYVNGQKITKGPLAPYISNPDHLLYYDRYDLAPYLTTGENVIGVLLGNGRQNNFGGFIWDFQLARFLAPPCFALSASILEQNGEETALVSNESFLTHPSPILFDDLHCGEDYDARLCLPGWATPQFDESDWQPARKAVLPRGEAKLCTAEPIKITEEISPVCVAKENTGWRYDFGVNSAGFFRLQIKGKAGQKLKLTFGEELVNGSVYTRNTRFHDEDRAQVVHFICSGKEDTYIPHFSYFGYRYILVEGLDEAQATASLLTMLVAHSAVETIGHFRCSDETLNTLQRMCVRSSLDNLYYFPTDCPHREKNGWTGDAALSCKQMLLNFAPEKSYAEWLYNIRKAQTERGALPGIIPTTGWGYHWGNGPAWDSALFTLPYYCYRYRGDTQIIKANAEAFLRWLQYIRTRREQDGTIACGLGDWLQPGHDPDKYVTPLAVTDTLITMRSAFEAAEMFAAVGMDFEQQYAYSTGNELKAAFRRALVEESMLVKGHTQTAQAMAIAFGIFEESEKPQAMQQLLQILAQTGNVMDTGILGGSVLFEVLCENGYADLAYELITQEKHPSFQDWIRRGATTMWEAFNPEGTELLSHNHHCWSFISGFFYTHLAGLRLNPDGKGADTLLIAPSFPSKLSFAQASHRSIYGEISVLWERNGDDICLTLSLPDEMHAALALPKGYCLKGNQSAPVFSGQYFITKAPSHS